MQSTVALSHRWLFVPWRVSGYTHNHKISKNSSWKHCSADAKYYRYVVRSQLTLVSYRN